MRDEKTIVVQGGVIAGAGTGVVAPGRTLPPGCVDAGIGARVMVVGIAYTIFGFVGIYLPQMPVK